MNISLKDIGYVLAVARLGSFTQAAESSAVSQPALSKQIKTIEASLGTPLFERTKRKVLLTPFGERFVRQAQVVMDEADKLAEITDSQRNPLSGSFKLGVIASSCAYLLPHFVGDIQLRFPELQLIIKEGLTDPLIQDLKQGNLDAVIAAPTFDDDQLLHEFLFFEPFLLATQHGKGYKGKIKTVDFKPEELLLLEDCHCLKDQTLDLCHIDSTASALNFRATSLETLLQMTAGGLGVSVIPKLAAESTPLAAKLDFMAFSEKQIGREMMLFYRQSYPWGSNIQLLAEFIKKHLPSSIMT